MSISVERGRKQSTLAGRSNMCPDMRDRSAAAEAEDAGEGGGEGFAAEGLEAGGMGGAEGRDQDLEDAGLEVPVMPRSDDPEERGRWRLADDDEGGARGCVHTRAMWPKKR